VEVESLLAWWLREHSSPLRGRQYRTALSAKASRMFVWRSLASRNTRQNRKLIWSTFLREATNGLSSTFLLEATRSVETSAMPSPSKIAPCQRLHRSIRRSSETGQMQVPKLSIEEARVCNSRIRLESCLLRGILSLARLLHTSPNAAILSNDQSHWNRTCLDCV